MCYLKGGTLTVTSLAGRTAYVKLQPPLPPPPPPPPHTPPPCTGFGVGQPDTELYGSTRYSATVVGSVAQCCTACSADSVACMGFVKYRGMCYLKGGTLTVTSRAGRTAYVKLQPPLPPPPPPIPPLSPFMADGIFCFIVVTPGEVPAMRQILDVGGTDAFAGCDHWRIYSNRSHIPTISDHPLCHACVEKAMSGSMKVERGDDWNSVLNAPVFWQVWSHILASGVYRSYGWTIKTEVDVVFLAHRLRTYLKEFPGTHWWESAVGAFRAHSYWDYPYVQGPLQILTNRAMQMMADGGYGSCRREHFDHNLLEDVWLMGCTHHLRIPWVTMEHMLLNPDEDDHLNLDVETECNANSTAFHKLTFDKWADCFWRVQNSSDQAFESQVLRHAWLN